MAVDLAVMYIIATSSDTGSTALPVVVSQYGGSRMSSPLSPSHPSLAYFHKATTILFSAVIETDRSKHCWSIVAKNNHI
jgi:hypothetical protein